MRTSISIANKRKQKDMLRRAEALRRQQPKLWESGAYWDQRYGEMLTEDDWRAKCWTRRCAHTVLDFIEQHQLDLPKALVPGCGISATAGTLAFAGYNVDAFDVSTTAIAHQKEQVVDADWVDRHLRILRLMREFPTAFPTYTDEEDVAVRALRVDRIRRPGGSVHYVVDSWHSWQGAGYDLMVLEHCFKGCPQHRVKKALMRLAGMCNPGAFMLFFEVNCSNSSAVRVTRELGMSVDVHSFIPYGLDQRERRRGVPVHAIHFLRTG